MGSRVQRQLQDPQQPRSPQAKATMSERAQAETRPGLNIREERNMFSSDQKPNDNKKQLKSARQSRLLRRPTLSSREALGQMGGEESPSIGEHNESPSQNSRKSSKSDSKFDLPRRSFRMELGFSNIAEQVQRKSVKRGFEFTLMVAGDSGLGKSTLINALFLSDLYKDREIPEVSARIEKTTEISRTNLDIEERGIKLRLSVVDTPGFGDALDGQQGWRACVKYVDDQFGDFFRGERGLHRKHLVDSRVHCCLYFIPPYGRGLRAVDVEFLRQMQFKVNLIPIIAKADCLTKIELRRLKSRIRAQLEQHDIEVYQFPDCDSDEDEDFKAENERLKQSLPFAIISGTQVLEINGKCVRGRQLPWGFVEVDNPEHSDFELLKRFLIQTHMQDLKDVTHDVHYENYRINRLSRENGEGDIGSEAHVPSMDTDQLIKEKDQEIRRMHEMMTQMQAKLRAK